MKCSGLIFVFVALNAVGAPNCISADLGQIVPCTFTTRVGGYMAGFNEVTGENGYLIYKGRISKPERISPTIEQWTEFRRELDALNVWQWRADYFDRNVFDGSQWQLEIEFSDHILAVYGSNRWPDKDGIPRPTDQERRQEFDGIRTGKPRTDIYSTETFDRYVAAVERLLGGKSMR